MQDFKYHPEDFDFEEAIQNHRNRFEKKLGRRKSKKVILIRASITVAACISIILFIVYPFGKISESNQPEQTITLACQNKELIELEYYYTHIENTKINEIKLYAVDSNLLHQEVFELDSIVQSLCKDLNTAPNDERIIEMAVNHYQMKINTLNHILEQLKNINTNKTQSHEAINL